jgi:hypothetical protein
VLVVCRGAAHLLTCIMDTKLYTYLRDKRVVSMYVRSMPAPQVPLPSL